MIKGQLNGHRLLGTMALALVATAGLSAAAGARVTHGGAVPAYSAKVGRVPSSERVKSTLRISNDTTVVPAPKNAVARTSQRAALFAIGDLSPVHVDGRSFFPSVLFGLVTNSAMQPTCDLPGLAVPGPSPNTPTTECHKGLFYQRTPMWVVIQHGACTASNGGPALPSGSTPTAPPTTTTTTTTFDPAKCVLYTFVSAMTGKYLYAES